MSSFQTGQLILVCIPQRLNIFLTRSGMFSSWCSWQSWKAEGEEYSSKMENEMLGEGAHNMTRSSESGGKHGEVVNLVDLLWPHGSTCDIRH